jgi:hypothetical protein
LIVSRESILGRRRRNLVRVGLDKVNGNNAEARLVNGEDRDGGRTNASSN